jgi:diguanylate cyclase (GGDEF)-like protein
MNASTGSGGHPALTDEETGLPNRLHFDTVFAVVFGMGRRGIPLTLLLLEVDGFQEWAANTDAQEVGRVLRTAGSTVARVIRQSDILARADEAQFALCLIDCNLAGAVLVADRIDGHLDSLRESSGLRFSLGAATFDPDMEKSDELMEAAEASLQVAQDRGGDQMEFRR